MTFATTAFVSGQNNALEQWAKKDSTPQAVNVKKSKVSANVVKDAGFYLEKSAKYQYTAIGLSGAAACLTMAGSLMKDKYDNNKGEPTMKTNKARTACFVGSGICTIAAICCEIQSINYKLKSGRSLKLYATGTGGGLSYNF